PFEIGARGALMLGKHLESNVVVNAAGPADALPYAGQLVPHMPLSGVAIVSGVDRRMGLSAVVDGTTASERLDGIVGVAPDGAGTVGPITIDGNDGRALYARIALDRPHNQNLVVADVDRFPLRPAAVPSLPGFPGKALPPVSGIIQAQGVALQSGSQLGFLGGDLDVSAARVAGFAIDDARAHVSGDARSIGISDASVRGPWGSVDAVGSVALRSGGFDALAAVTDGRIARASFSGSTLVSLSGGTLRISNAGAVLEGGYGRVEGAVAGLRSAAGPRYDLAALIRGAPFATLVHTFGVRVPYPEGSFNADVRVGGAGASPTVAGDVAIPDGGVNGLDFAAAARINGGADGVAASNGKIVVGSTRMSFDADLGRGQSALALRAPRVDLSDFNDYFDAADTLGGKGSLALDVTGLTDPSPQTSGNVAIKAARYRTFPLGDTTARWSTTARGVISATASVNGRGGRLDVAGTMARRSIAVNAHARAVDLGVWLPAAGINAPIVGRLDADGQAQGPLGALALSGTAALHDGIVGHIPVQRLTVAADARNGRVRLASAQLEVPNLSATASGVFGLHPRDPIDLTARGHSADVGALAMTTLGKQYPIGGALDTTVHLTGSRVAPHVDDALDVSDFRYKTMTVPHAHAEVVASQTALDLKNGVVDLQRGSLGFAAHAPLSSATSFAFNERAEPMGATITARAIDLAQFAPLFPKGTKLGGQIDGTLGVAGTYAAPTANGAVVLSRGSFSSPQVASPITNGTFGLVFEGTSASISKAHFDVGGGSLDATGSATLVAVNGGGGARDVRYDLKASARHAALDLPSYFRGTVDGAVAIDGLPGAIPSISGDVAFSHARVPLSAIYNPKSSKNPNQPVPKIAFSGLQLRAGSDVRIQGPAVDVGGTGAATLGGTLAAPTLNGSFSSTGGSVNFYRNFTIDTAHVAFSPDLGIMPRVFAVATTHVPDPSTDVQLRVSGIVPDLNLALSSDPVYDRTQILGLLIGVQNFGALSGVAVAQNQGSPLGGVTQGVVNQLFARTVLEPLQVNLGEAFGLKTINLGYSVGGGFSANASRALGRNLTASFSDSYGYPQRQTVGLEEHLSAGSSLGLTVFSSEGNPFGQTYESYLLNQPGTNISLQATEPALGTSGFSVHYIRRFK
ncbi:MAG: translocation/assembly module TamB domain-containing protein, partial [Candidatus Eremiobacteraeota bacterium]|nr:translocation/assembly module TamB domain-containing protein [Candidatus Eremiobacteraeota bacterium]